MVDNLKKPNKIVGYKDLPSRDLKELLRFERLISDVSARLINISASEVDIELEKCLDLVVSYLSFDRSAIMQFFDDHSILKWTHYSGARLKEKPNKFLISSQHKWFTGKLRRGETIIISSPKDIEAKVERNWMIKVGMKSNMTIPLAVGGKILGGIAFSSFSKKITRPNEVVTRLRMLGEVFASTLMRKQFEIQLKEAFCRIKTLKDQLHKENIYLKEEIKTKDEYEGIVYKSNSIKQLLSQVEQVAGTKSTVLILGKTGTGKELFANAIHKHSPRSNRALVKVNCAALPATLVEAELFGREKGAYTGALTQQIGRFEVADGSTIFLDEIGELDIGLQAKMLRIIQEGQFERLGSTKTITVDVRIIAATNQDLAKNVQNGKFREDLYYRLNVFPMVVPPLRERKEDIPLLVWTFIKEFEDTMGKTIERVTEKTMETLKQFSWPGNIRELKNIIERSMILSKDGVLDVILPKQIDNMDLNNTSFKEAERTHILKILKKSNWRIRGENGAAEMLELKPSTLESKMIKLKIKRRK